MRHVVPTALAVSLLVPSPSAARPLDAELAEFQARHGSGWSLLTDPASERPRRLAGGAIAWIDPDEAAGPQDLVEPLLIARAWEFVGENEALLGVETGRIRPATPSVIIAARGRLAAVHLDVVHHGVPVIGGRVTFAVSHGNLIHAHAVGTAPVRAEARPQVGPSTALRRAFGAASLADTDVGTGATPELLFLPVEGGHRLVWQVTMIERERPRRRVARVDAVTGELVSLTDETVSACPPPPPAGLDKRVLGGVVREGATDPERQELFAEVDVDGSVAGTDGLFAPPAATYDAALAGPAFAVQCEGCTLPTAIAAAGGLDGDVDFGFGGSDAVGNGTSTPADRACYFHSEAARRLTSRWSSPPFLAAAVPIRTNIPSACNAYWDGSSINFFRSSASCGNTGLIRDVIQHEWGHGLDENDGLPPPGLSIDAATGEAAADIVALLRSRDACIGEGFHLDPGAFPSDACDGVRDLDEKAPGHERGTLSTTNVVTECPGSGFYRGPLGREGHCEGEILGQAAWHLVQDLITGTSYADGTPLPAGNGPLAEDDAWEVVERLFFLSRPFLASYAPMALQSIGMSAYDAFLIADDEGDGIANGTPHAAAINEAFGHHGLLEAMVAPDAPAVPTPAAPAVVTTSMVDPASGRPAVQVDWTDVGAPGYLVLRADDADDAYLPLDAPAGAGAGSFVDRGVLPGRTYRYRVVALDASGRPSLGAAPVTASAGAILRVANVVVDDSLLGNGNGLLEVGETADLAIDLENYGTGPATDLGVTLATTEPALAVTVPGPIAYGTVPGSTLAPSPAPFQVRADPGVPRFVYLNARGDATEGCHDVEYLLEIAVPWLDRVDQSIDDTVGGDGSGTWEPGETIDLTVSLENTGLLDAVPVDGTISFRGAPVTGVTLARSTASWGLVAAGAGPVPTSPPPFSLHADATLGPRTKVPLRLDVQVGGTLHRSFDIDLTVGGFPEGQWEWSFDPAHLWTVQSLTPLVMHVNDDDGDGEITTCDVPDIVVIALELLEPDRLLAMSGDSGAIHWEYLGVNNRAFAAIAGGDIDGDGSVEIVVPDVDGHVSAFNGDGTLLWRTADPTQADQVLAAASNAAISPQVWDLDGDGTAEVVAGLSVLRGADGSVLWERTDANRGKSLVADFDLDGQQEVLSNHAVYRADGSPYVTSFFGPYVGNTATQAVNIDSDPFVEISVGGVITWNHDGGARIYDIDLPMQRYPVGPPCAADIDGDGFAEQFVSNRRFMNAIEEDGTIRWSTPIDDSSGGSGCSIFDFDGDGIAEIVYRDEVNLHVFDAQDGTILWQVPIRHGTAHEYPIVADVDADGSAEIVVLGSSMTHSGSLHVFGNPNWPPALQVWNQENYSVTHVTELGGIVSDPYPRWLGTNDYRGQAPGQDFTCLCNSPSVSVTSTVPACGDTIVCFEAMVADGVAPHELTWDFGDGSPPVVTGPTPCHVYPAPGAYGVEVSVGDANGCAATGGIVADTRPNFAVGFVPPPDCPSDPACLTAVPSEGVPPFEFAWDFHDGSPLELGDVACRMLPPGSHQVTLHGRDAVGCLAETTHSFDVMDVSLLREVSPAGSASPLLVTRDGNQLTLRFEDLGLITGIYQGDVGLLHAGYSHRPMAGACGRPGDEAQFTAPVGALKYFLAVAAACSAAPMEGPYGFDSMGTARPSAPDIGNPACP